MALKLHLKKASDRLDWDFIRKTLHFLQLFEDMINLIMTCISPSTMSILVSKENSTALHLQEEFNKATIYLSTFSPYVWSILAILSIMLALKRNCSPSNAVLSALTFLMFSLLMISFFLLELIVNPPPQSTEFLTPFIENQDKKPAFKKKSSSQRTLLALENPGSLFTNLLEFHETFDFSCYLGVPNSPQKSQ
ncbi:hypothetical protein PVK06_009151 [Gossypium arboreum]|uniref:Uncharacterized protein n=1 Tax=Gossypium arboreum TaxID=29729 RepID=A0ABR0QM60_GOSAR|nr:hypothetical protein PVK06_009151 [Gossypium arboreum]